jgi:hypothetical protein
MQAHIFGPAFDTDRHTTGTNNCATTFYNAEGPRFCGVFLFQVSVMHNQSDFFQEQIKKCNELAERASNETDRNFWLRMARRWEVI